MNFNFPDANRRNIFKKIFNVKAVIKMLPELRFKIKICVLINHKLNKSLRNWANNINNTNKQNNRWTSKIIILKQMKTMLLYTDDYTAKVNNFINNNKIRMLDKIPTNDCVKALNITINASTRLFDNTTRRWLKNIIYSSTTQFPLNPIMHTT